MHLFLFGIMVFWVQETIENEKLAVSYLKYMQ